MLDHYKVGNYISLLRKEKGLTGEKLAEILNVSPQAVSKWENGKCLPESSLLPMLASTLGTSIDALLIPRQLIVLSAIFTDGIDATDVTQIINNYVNGNVLNITVNQQFLGMPLNSQRINVITIKYQTPSGIFYDFALEDSILLIDLQTPKYKMETNFNIIGAYYGNKKDKRSVMQKIQHYDYFKWNEIPVNNESFPSTAESSETDYLTLIYLNNEGIKVISYEENEVLCYSQDRTSLFLQDTSTCILPNIITLEWEKEMDCTWAGSVYTALQYMGESYTYEQLMGLSGACYRIAFTEVWDWSAVDALVAFDYSSILFHAIGYEQIWADRVEKEDRSSERIHIVDDIKNGKPVVAINLRIAPEWGVITGYRENGKIILCRTYFDQEYLNDVNDYLESDFWPFLIIHFGERKDKPSEYERLMTSLRVLVASFEAPCERGYYQGKEAYEKWIEGLQNESIWDCYNSKEDIERRLCVNDYMLLNLIDARRCAYSYLNDNLNLLIGKKKELLALNIDLYEQVYNKLKDFRASLIQSNLKEVKYMGIKTKYNFSSDFRYALTSLLNDVLEMERKIVNNTNSILNEK